MTSADFVLISADDILKLTTILNQLRIVQLCSKNRLSLEKIAKISSKRIGKRYHQKGLAKNISKKWAK